MNNTTRATLVAALLGVITGADAAEGDAAAGTSTASMMLEEITVTANRREQNLQDVPISVAAYTAEDLQSAAIQTTQDIAIVTPGLTLANQSGAMTPFIRGIGAVDNTVGQEAAVSTYVDGVYIPSAYGSLFEFNNVERVEVLKGPQGTLFGRNATGGLIQVITRTPSDKTSVEGSASIGNFGTTGAKLYATTGLGESLAADLAVLYRDQSDGFGRNVTTGKDVGFLGDNLGARSKLAWNPNDRASVTLAVDYFRTENVDAGNVKTFVPGAISTIDQLPGASGFFDSRQGGDAFIDTDQWGASITASYEFAPFTLKSITAYRHTNTEQAFDNDATPIIFLDVSIDEQRTRTTTQELQLLSGTSSPFQWIVGAFWLKDESGFQGPLGLGLYGLALGGGGVQLKNTIDTDSYAIYADATFDIASSTKLTVGGRWTHDEREITGRTDVVDSPIPPGNRLLSIPAPSDNFTEGEPTWRVVLQHEFQDGPMVYASYNRGFKSGNYNTVSPADAPFDSEKVDAYEVGLKSDLLERRLRLNAAVFYSEYKNLQLPSLSGSFLTTTNAADSEIKGVELEAELVATDNLRLRLGTSFLDTEFTSYPNAQCSSRSPAGITTQFVCDASGNELTRSPKNTTSAALLYDLPSAIGPFAFNIAYLYNSGFKWEPDNRLKETAYSLVNASIGWERDDGSFGVTAWGKNLANEEYSLWKVAFALGDEYAPAPPRTYGLEARFKF